MRTPLPEPTDVADDAAAQIAALLPEHDHYVEPIAGSLSVLLAKSPSRLETVNDADRHIGTFWKVLRERPSELARACALSPHSRAEFADAYCLSAPPPSGCHNPGRAQELETARCVWVRVCQGQRRARRPAASPAWQAVIGSGRAQKPMADVLDGYLYSMAAAAKRLRNVSLECRTAIDIVKSVRGQVRTCLYVDLRPAAGGRAFIGTGRQGGVMPAAQRDALISALTRCKATVVVRSVGSQLDSVFAPMWSRTPLAEEPTMSGGTVEALWCNRALLTQQPLFDVADGSLSV